MNNGKLFLIGLGLGNEKDITLKGLECIGSCEKIYLEHYTSILTVGKERLVNKKLIKKKESFYSKQLNKEIKIEIADREFIEQKCDDIILEEAKDKKVAILVVGDPFGATTHSDIVVRAKKLKINVEAVHNAR
jgi:diphthine methyl ester synthase